MTLLILFVLFVQVVSKGTYNIKYVHFQTHALGVLATSRRQPVA